MRLDHIALYTGDLERLKSFYQEYFGGVANSKYHNPNTGLETYFLSFEDGARLELMTRPGLEPGGDRINRTGYVHLAFNVGGESAVDGLTAKLEQDGYTAISGPRRTGDGYYESCVRDPDGNLVEIVA